MWSWKLEPQNLTAWVQILPLPLRSCMFPQLPEPQFLQLQNEPFCIQLVTTVWPRAWHMLHRHQPQSPLLYHPKDPRPNTEWDMFAECFLCASHLPDTSSAFQVALCPHKDFIAKQEIMAEGTCVVQKPAAQPACTANTIMPPFPPL